MKSKLTINLEQKLIEEVEKYASDHETSIDLIVEDFLISLIDFKPKKYPKIIEEMIGIARTEDVDLNYKAAKERYLNEKYLKG